MKRGWLFWLLAIGFAVIVVTRIGELKTLAHTLVQGQPGWIAAAVVLQVVYFLCYTGLYWSSLDAAGVRGSLWHLVPVTLASLFVNVVAPTGGVAGTAVYIDDAARRGQSATRATAGTLLALIGDMGTFCLVLASGLIYLLVRHDLRVYEVIAAAVLLAVTVGMVAVLILGLLRPVWLERLFGWGAHVANGIARRLHRQPLVADTWADENAREFVAAAAAIVAHPGAAARSMGIGLLEQLADVASVYALGRAFAGPISIGVVVAAYGVGVLFWLVAITPGGIGVVEGLMPLVFTSLGVAGNAATVITLAFRGLTFWLPLLLGFIALRRIRTFGGREQAIGEAWSVRLPAVLTGLTGIVNVLSAVTPSLAARIAILRRILPLAVREGGHLTAALAGFALLLLAANLWRGKRVAWWLTMAALLVSIVSHLVKGLDYGEASLAAGLMVWLFVARHRFHARSDPPSLRGGLRVLAVALGFTLVYGTAGFYFLDRHFHVTYRWGMALRQTVMMLTQFYNPGVVPLTRFGRYFVGSIYVIAAVTIAYALIALMRPVFVRRPSTADQRARAASIVEAYGRSSLARFVLFDDKSYYFSPGGSVVAYVVKGRAAVTLGDPIGPASDVAHAIAGFKAICERNDWLTAFYQVLPDDLEAYRAAGLDILAVGQEAIVDLATFSLEGGANKHVRKAVHALTRAGYRTQALEPPLDDGVLEELRAVSDQWLTAMHGSEKRFSLGWFDDAYIRGGPAMVVRDENDAIVAFANILPAYRSHDVTIDLMRHRTDALEGTMDLLFVSLFGWAKQQGFEGFNLGLSSLSGVGQQAGDPAVERVLHYVYEHIDQFYSFQGLHQFKAKFHPRWEMRYLVYPGLASLPAVALALVRADSGDAFGLAYAKDWWDRRRLAATRPPGDAEAGT